MSGKVSGNAKGLPLFYIGDVTQKVQIRVSKVDHNDKLPNDDSAWKDFFVNNDESRF